MTNNKLKYHHFISKTKLLNLKDSVYFAWAITNNFQFNKSIPEDIQMRKEFNEKAPIVERRYWGINEWELEFLISEIIKNGLVGFKTQYTLRDVRCHGELINDTRLLEDAIYKEKSDELSDDLIFKHTFRIYHRQFGWQNPVHFSFLFRYYKIFSHPDLNKIIEGKINLSAEDIMKIGFTLSSMFLKNPSIPYPVKLRLKSISDEKAQVFLNTFACEYDILKTKLNSSDGYDENLFYKYNPLRETPIFVLDHELYCPFPTLFFSQFTHGLYYRIYNEPGFSKAFGQSFQDYVAFIVQKVLNNGTLLIAESKYKKGKDLKDSIDWILDSNESYLFIECKTKRLTLAAKSELSNNISLDQELDKMADFVFQSYKTLVDCQAGLYTNIKYVSEKPGFLLVLTLEDWFVNFHPVYYANLRPLIETKLVNGNIDPNIIETIPYFIDSIAGFERNIQLINVLGIFKYFTKLKANTIIEDSEKFVFTDILEEDFRKEIYASIVNPK